MAEKLSMKDIDSQLEFLNEVRAVDPGPDVLAVIDRIERELLEQRRALAGEAVARQNPTGGKRHRRTDGIMFRTRLQHS